jgi:hypothetical protein
MLRTLVELIDESPERKAEKRQGLVRACPPARRLRRAPHPPLHACAPQPFAGLAREDLRPDDTRVRFGCQMCRGNERSPNDLVRNALREALAKERLDLRAAWEPLGSILPSHLALPALLPSGAAGDRKTETAHLDSGLLAASVPSLHIADEQ